MSNKPESKKDESSKNESKKQLHLTFVEMLFALAIGQIAIEISKLIDYQLTSSQSFWSVVPAYSHLLLAFVVISTSWVGWRNSRFCGSTIEDVFSLDYIELAFDIALVVMYFILARAVEIPCSRSDSLAPNASFEAKTVAVIITSYLFWDLISCRTNLKKKITQRMWVPVCCTVISWVLVWQGLGATVSVKGVLFADLCLIFLILTFRAMKRQDLSNHSKKSWALIFLMLLLVLIFFVGSIKL